MDLPRRVNENKGVNNRRRDPGNGNWPAISGKIFLRERAIRTNESEKYQ